MLNARFIDRFNGFLNAASKLCEDHRKSAFPMLPALKPLYAMEGGRYIRVVREDGQRMVYCFVDKTNGDVLMAATWKAPAKHARSNIWDEDLGLSGLTPYGAKYLK